MGPQLDWMEEEAGSAPKTTNAILSALDPAFDSNRSSPAYALRPSLIDSGPLDLEKGSLGTEVPHFRTG